MKNFETKQELDNLLEEFDNEFEFFSGDEAVSHVFDQFDKKIWEKVIKYPYPEMNKVLRGIFPTSFIIIGADYGSGKSELCGDIAIHAAKQNKKVLYFDFENDNGDFVRRQICREYQRRYRESFTVADLVLFNPEDDEIKAEKIYSCSEKIREQIQNMQIFKNDKLPTIEQFIAQLEIIENVDLVCIDHLHYFDFDQGQSEKEQLSKVMRQLRLLTKYRNIPVILVSHLTKRDKSKKPTASDFHGSSNIAKEAKTAILLHRTDQGNTMYIDKNREGGKTAQIPYSYNYGFDFNPKSHSGF